SGDGNSTPLLQRSEKRHLLRARENHLLSPAEADPHPPALGVAGHAPQPEPVQDGVDPVSDVLIGLAVELVVAHQRDHEVPEPLRRACLPHLRGDGVHLFGGAGPPHAPVPVIHQQRPIEPPPVNADFFHLVRPAGEDDVADPLDLFGGRAGDDPAAENINIKAHGVLPSWSLFCQDAGAGGTCPSAEHPTTRPASSRTSPCGITRSRRCGAASATMRDTTSSTPGCWSGSPTKSPVPTWTIGTCTPFTVAAPAGVSVVETRGGAPSGGSVMVIGRAHV